MSSSTGGTGYGLSPRVRGNQGAVLLHRLGVGSIPARAGEPTQGCASSRRYWVYPRACGGTREAAKLVADAGGLSPRVRGNLATEYERSAGERSIPARAGEPQTPPDGLRLGGVYPRACGGTSGRTAAPPFAPGLSPRVRGNRRQTAGMDGETGSIPARAGEPPGPARSPCRARVYPRACGGTPATRLRTVTRTGLSPRVRGNLFQA